MSTATQIRDTPKRSNASRQICGLDIVRFAAALLVVMHHFGFWVFTVIPDTWSSVRPIAAYTWYGWIGVDIFFVLSGFVIAYSAEKATPRGFAISRIVRLYPALWICSTLTSVIALLSRDAPFNRIFLISWLNGFFLAPVGPVPDGVYWTLRVEITFYLLIFLILLAGLSRYIGEIMTFVGVLASVAWVYSALMVTRTPSHWPGRMVIFLFSTELPHGSFFFPRYAPFFAVGVLLWLCLLRGATPARLLSMALCSVGAILEIKFHAVWIADSAGLQYSATVPVIIWIAAIAVMALCVRFNSTIGELLGPRGVAICRTVGLMTYPLYLIHARVGYILFRFLHPHLPDYLCMSLLFILAIAVSWFISNYLEQPIQSWLRRVLGRFQQRPVMAPIAGSLP